MKSSRDESPYNKVSEFEEVPIVNASRLQMFRRREKLLPANCHRDGSSHVLFQLEKVVRFKCSYCEKRNIVSDEVALDEKRQTLQCKKCYGRLIRPRLFSPLKIHPSQTYHKWLRGRSYSYDKQRLYSLAKRLSLMNLPLLKYNELDVIPVEAFYPSGNRIASQQSFEDILSMKYMCGIEGGEFERSQLPTTGIPEAAPGKSDAKALQEYLKNSEQ